MITFKRISTLEEAKTLWEIFSPHEELYDEWDFRFTYWQFEKPEICFIVGYEDDNPFGLLPLQWNNNGYFEFFGGDFMSYNLLFIKGGYEQHRAEFLKQVDKPLCLRWMREPIEHEKLTVSEKSTYFLPLEGISSLDEYMRTFLSSTRRKQLSKEMRKILRGNTELLENNFEDLSLLVELNKKKFGENSVFNKPHREEFFKKMLERFQCYTLTVVIDGEKAAVGLRIIYNDTLYGINTGVTEGTANLGKFLYLKAIEYATAHNLKKYDALEGAYNWKEIFGFHGRPQYHLDLRSNH